MDGFIFNRGKDIYCMVSFLHLFEIWSLIIDGTSSERMVCMFVMKIR
jgi:hypothetical protein